MSCVRLTLKKYTTRPSPPYHASDCKGETIRGNDNKLYTSIADKRGVYTWKLQTVTNKTRKQPKGKQSYQTHHNYNRPFLVEVNIEKKEIDVYKLMYDETVKKHIIDVYKGFYKYKNIWIGNGPVVPTKVGTSKGLKSEKYPGHAILAQLTNGDMLFIGNKVFTFKMLSADKPEKFISYVGNNDVPYSYLVGKTHTYLLQEEVAIDSEKLDSKEDAYKQYYVDKVPGKKFRIKTISK